MKKLFTYLKETMSTWFVGIDVIECEYGPQLTMFYKVLLRILMYTIATPVIFIIAVFWFIRYGLFLKKNHEKYLEACKEYEIERNLYLNQLKNVKD